MNKIYVLSRKIGGSIKRFLKPKINRDIFGGRKNVVEINEANLELSLLLKKESPVSIIRMGFAELNLIYEIEKNISTLRFDKLKNKKMKSILDNKDINYLKYHELIVDSYKKADMISNWYSSKYEAKLIEKYSTKSVLTPASVLEPYFIDNPWSQELEGKKVLVIHPFVDTIKKQYEKRQLIFGGSKVLPNFDLYLIPSIWYGFDGKDERFSDWFEALDYLKKEIDKVDFDIALLGCGPFGVPLVTYIKDIGKKAIYIGGALQILFGIKGARWDQKKKFKDLYNEYWVRPDEEYRPVSSKKLDGECYW